MLLATPEALMGRLSQSTSIGHTEGVAISVLRAATPIIETLLGTELSEREVTDYFDYRIWAFRSRFEPVKLLLSHGMVDGESALVVYERASGYSSLQSISQGSVVDAGDYYVGYESGSVVLLRDVAQGNPSIAVTYLSGFGVDAEGVFKNVPVWLQEAAISIGVEVMQAHAVTRAKIDVRDMAPHMRRVASSQLNSHIRPRYGLYPARVVIAD